MSYTTATRREVLKCVEANGIRAASRFSGVPYSTIRSWMGEPRGEVREKALKRRAVKRAAAKARKAISELEELCAQQ
jgi:hypothetical protein